MITFESATALAHVKEATLTDTPTNTGRTPQDPGWAFLLPFLLQLQAAEAEATPEKPSKNKTAAKPTAAAGIDDLIQLALPEDSGPAPDKQEQPDKVAPAPVPVARELAQILGLEAPAPSMPAPVIPPQSTPEKAADPAPADPVAFAARISVAEPVVTIPETTLRVPEPVVTMQGPASPVEAAPPAEPAAAAPLPAKPLGIELAAKTATPGAPIQPPSRTVEGPAPESMRPAAEIPANAAEKPDVKDRPAADHPANVRLELPASPPTPPQASRHVESSPGTEPAARPAEKVTSESPGSTPVREVAVRLSDPHHDRIDVRLVERSGEIRVAVRTPDVELTRGLRGDLGDLVNRLERAGYRAEVWRPAETAFSQNEHQRGSPQDEARDANPQARPDSQHQGRGRESQRQPRWAEEMENAF